MLTIAVSILTLSFIVTSGQILLYNTENNQKFEKFDCLYHIRKNGEKIPYCRRLKENGLLARDRKKCENEGEMQLFRSLLEQNIEPMYVLSWNSSIETVDIYASIFYNQSRIEPNDYRFLCKCIKAGTFGKYCEYELTHDAQSFDEALNIQFQQKRTDSWNTQRYGKILCYETLSCESSILCLDWREICDGLQRCKSGIDEENCDLLEFNECEDDEFRCTDGMCIPEQSWLDGEYDCMDWSDELPLSVIQCHYQPLAMDCDEHTCAASGLKLYSCGDGQCVAWKTRMAFQRFLPAENDCFNKRNLNYMCEASPHRSSWTLQDGLCSPDTSYDDPRYPSWNRINSSKLTLVEQCQYLFRCHLSNGFERDCPCKRHNCTEIMMHVCPANKCIVYPTKGLINSNMFNCYDYRQSLIGVVFFGGIKCRGYHLTMLQNILNFNTTRREAYEKLFITEPYFNRLPCIIGESAQGYKKDPSSPFQYDKFCWNQSRTFNNRPYAVNPDVCASEGHCISQYRIHNGFEDCFMADDEEMGFKNNYCTGNVGRQRFQCFTDQHRCLSHILLGSRISQCSNNYDELWYGSHDYHLDESHECYSTEYISKKRDCDRLKEYVRESSGNISNNHSLFVDSQEYMLTNEISFRFYCDSFWHLKEHQDENPSFCQYWICPNNYYRCQTGQCIPINWVCDGEWDCADASDEEAIVLIQKWSSHNVHLFNLNYRRQQCQKLYFQSPFSTICNTSFELGCYRVGVSNPLDIELNRPCINLTQIGDGIEDCYNAYDEKNTFQKELNALSMWGFNLRCENSTLSYSNTCPGGMEKNCTKILCSNHRDQNGSCFNHNDVICLGNNQCKKNARCNKIIDCPYGEDEYWCGSYSLLDQIEYRKTKTMTDIPLLLLYNLKQFPPMSNKPQVLNYIFNTARDNLTMIYSYQCNRGLSIIEMNETRCLCPPAYYGNWCEFFSDRISIIVSIDHKTIPINLFKIRSNLIFNNIIIDFHEFGSFRRDQNSNQTKYKFYLLYSRSEYMIAHKRQRYFDRTDILNNHPYSIHFDVFSIETNDRMREIGSWHYPIYFDYLPAFRLAITLRFPSWFENVTFDPCQSNNCNQNSNCIPIFNQNKSFYCSCKNGYYGKTCDMYQSRCENYCSSNSFCRVDNNSNPYCICSMNRFGPRCNLKHDYCISNPCLNNGTCQLDYRLNGEITYKCNCLLPFYGYKCQDIKESVRIQLNMTNRLSIQAAVVQFYILQAFPVSKLQILHQQAYYGLPSIVLYYYDHIGQPSIGILKTYEDLSNPQYMIMHTWQSSVIDITVSPQDCPHSSSLITEDRNIPSVFKYHQICRNNTERLCFYDKDYLCICQSDHYRAECFLFDSKSDHCSKCLSGGKCLQGNQQDQKNFICLCPSCYQGDQCEFSLQPFSFTLDSLLIGYSKEVKIIYATLALLIFIIGLFNNFCSFVTFKRPIPRKVGVGNYLFIVTCLNQMILFCLLLKFIQITFEFSEIISCKIIPYCLSTFTRLTYWLTSWVSIDRFLLTLFPTSLHLKTPRRAIGIIIVTSIVLLGMHIHEIIYYTIIEHAPTGLPICLTNFDSIRISTYNRISTLIHYLCPFILQVICITLQIVLAARSRDKAGQKKMIFHQMLKKQFKDQKELYITPMIIILAALPQTILTFSLACTQLIDWQRHTLLTTYLISFAPQVLGFIFYVLPSTVYTDEFYQTAIGKNRFK